MNDEMNVLHANTSTNEIQYHHCASHSIQWQPPSVSYQNSTVHSPTHHPAGYIIHPIMIIPTNYFQPAVLHHHVNNSTIYSTTEQHIRQPAWSRIEGYGEFTSIQEAKHAALRHHDDDPSSPPQKLSWTRHNDKQFACATHFQCQHRLLVVSTDTGKYMLFSNLEPHGCIFIPFNGKGEWI